MTAGGAIPEVADYRVVLEPEDTFIGTVNEDFAIESMAIETFRKMMALGDENAVRAYQEIIDTYREAKQWQQATDAAKEATQKFPNDRTLKMTYATQIAETGQADDGVQKLKAMLKGTNEDRDVYMLPVIVPNPTTPIRLSHTVKATRR